MRVLECEQVKPDGGGENEEGNLVVEGAHRRTKLLEVCEIVCIYHFFFNKAAVKSRQGRCES